MLLILERLLVIDCDVRLQILVYEDYQQLAEKMETSTIHNISGMRRLVRHTVQCKNYHHSSMFGFIIIR